MGEWVDIGFGNGYYQISRNGLVRSVDRKLSNGATNRGVLRIPTLSKNGYHYIDLYCEGKRKRYYVHRLVAIAFIPNPNGYKIVNHINGIKVDNRVENLEWSTYSKNLIHAYRTGLNKNIGVNHWNAKLSDNEVLGIREELRKERYKQYEIAEMYGVSDSTISEIKHCKKRNRIIKTNRPKQKLLITQYE